MRGFGTDGAEPPGPDAAVAEDEDYHLGDAIRFFLDAKRAGGRSPRTLDEYRKKLDLFQRWAAAKLGGEGGVNVPLLLIGSDEVEAYVVHLKEGRGLSDASRKNHLAVLKSFFDTLSRRLDVPDPTRRLDEVRFHHKAPKRNYLTKTEAGMLLGTVERGAEEAARLVAGAAESDGSDAVGRGRQGALLEALALRDHAVFSAMIYAGLRIEEAASLEVGDLSFSRGTEEVRVAKGKGNKERVVPMSPKLKRSLRRYLAARGILVPAGEADPRPLFLNERGSRVTENTLRRRLYGWVRRSSLKKAGITPHDLRRTFGTWYLQDNPGQLVELAALMGHSDLSQVSKYALSDEERARSGVSRL